MSLWPVWTWKYAGTGTLGNSRSSANLTQCKSTTLPPREATALISLQVLGVLVFMSIHSSHGPGTVTQTGGVTVNRAHYQFPMLCIPLHIFQGNILWKATPGHFSSQAYFREERVQTCCHLFSWTCSLFLYSLEDLVRWLQCLPSMFGTFLQQSHLGSLVL